MTTPAGDRYIEHRQRGFAAKDAEGRYKFDCVCGSDSGYLPEVDGKRVLVNHLAYPNGGTCCNRHWPWPHCAMHLDAEDEVGTYCCTECPEKKAKDYYFDEVWR